MITLTCAIGTFKFSEDTPLVLAKMVRDMVMGQLLCPKSGEKPIKTVEQCKEYVRRQDEVIKKIDFEMDLRDNFEIKVMAD